MLAPWITPSATRVAWYACSAFDTPTPTSTGTSVIALRRAGEVGRRLGQRRPLAGHAEQPDRVQEAAGTRGDARQSLVGRGRRGQHDRLDAVGVGGFAPRPGLLERQVGQDRREMPARSRFAANRSGPGWWTRL